MSRDKQISELAKVLNECCNNYDENGNHLGNKCYGCECWSSTNGVCCSYNTKEATHLYNAGYRKASEVAEEIFAEIEKCSEVALMNGHIETPILCIGFGVLAELKKKYTESEKENG